MDDQLQSTNPPVPEEDPATASTPQPSAPPTVPAVPEPPKPTTPPEVPTPPTPPPVPTPSPAVPPASESTPPATPEAIAPAPVAPPPTAPAVASAQPTASTPSGEPNYQGKGAGKYEVRVIKDKCIGAASCVAVAPKAFKLNDEQIAEVLKSVSEESDDNLLLAAQSCPTLAIEVINTETGEKVWPK